MFDDNTQQQIHTGNNIRRIREMLGIKQDALATIIGMSQQYISKIENSVTVSDENIEKFAVGLGVSIDFIKKFDEEKAVYNIQSNFTVSDSGSNNQNYLPSYNHTNDFEKLFELMQQLIQSEKEKYTLLEKTNEALHQIIKDLKK